MKGADKLSSTQTHLVLCRVTICRNSPRCSCLCKAFQSKRAALRLECLTAIISSRCLTWAVVVGIGHPLLILVCRYIHSHHSAAPLANIMVQTIPMPRCLRTHRWSLLMDTITLPLVSTCTTATIMVRPTHSTVWHLLVMDPHHSTLACSATFPCLPILLVCTPIKWRQPHQMVWQRALAVTSSHLVRSL